MYDRQALADIPAPICRDIKPTDRVKTGNVL